MLLEDVDRYTTLGQVKEALRNELQRGAKCPCCGQTVKLYRRKIYGSMAVALIKFYRYAYEHGIDKPHHVFKALSNNGYLTGDFAKFRYWGLISSTNDTRTDGSTRAGFYYITQKGIDFINGKEIKKYLYFYDGKEYPNKEVINELITIEKALGKKFNFEELMEGLPKKDKADQLNLI